jgi:cobalamin biosynthesis Mg chelatase CobN
MNVGKRHRRAPQWAHLSLLMSVIALALACFPVLAQAECTSSSCVQYTESIPSAEGGNPSKQHHQQTPAKASKTGQGNGSQPSQPGGSQSTKEAEKSGEGEASEKEGAVGSGSGGNGQGKPGGSAHEGGKQAMNPGAQNTPGVQASKSSDSGGSSPLVPILIAIAVLAAISVAVVMIRQRRQRRGPTASASPEAN